MKRSAVAALVVVLVALPMVAFAQQAGKVYRIGVLAAASPASELTGPDPSNLTTRVFLHRLRELGYVYGRNMTVEARSAEGRAERFATLATELVSLNTDVIVVPNQPAARAAKAATATIPIVMVGVTDPVGAGLIASLARPGGNLTGLTYDAGPEIAGKRLELLKDAVPKIAHVAVMTTTLVRKYAGAHIESAARALGMTIVHVPVDSPDDYAGAFDTVTRHRADALLAAESALNFVHYARIVKFAATRRLPAMYASRVSVEAGGLMAYGIDNVDLYRRAAVYVDKILKGVKPADLPVEQPQSFELVVNLQTARTLGITIPPSVLVQAEMIP